MALQRSRGGEGRRAAAGALDHDALSLVLERAIYTRAKPWLS